MPHEAAEKHLSSSKVSKHHKKLPRLPANAVVHKRPLLHPQIPSPYSGPQKPKTIYVSTNTPFLSAVKRGEKLLRLAEKRAVQSATTLVSQNRGKRKRRDGDELLEIAETVESDKKRRKLSGQGADAREEVLFKGTGKAIQKVLELALWFQHRDEYVVQVKTGSVGAVDDITFENPPDEADESETKDNEEEKDGVVVDTGQPLANRKESLVKGRAQGKERAGQSRSTDEAISETRVRYTSVLEVAVSLR